MLLRRGTQTPTGGALAGDWRLTKATADLRGRPIQPLRLEVSTTKYAASKIVTDRLEKTGFQRRFMVAFLGKAEAGAVDGCAMPRHFTYSERQQSNAHCKFHPPAGADQATGWGRLQRLWRACLVEPCPLACCSASAHQAFAAVQWW